ncbi:unnamed protein product [Microthlaspi erraticum]|uniref:F-box domain-containing protein n=1 Tax=Microthlaspi erraticum TaxID=1685480 RepID=A0A6D2ITN9_9BRAS|nr:unnamed protein product [Microthlaspi erraticum]
MMIPDLPLDLVEEILAKVPAISLKRLRSICKRWNALFKDQRFIEKHLRFHEATKQLNLLMLKEYRVCNVKLNLNVASPSLEFKGALGLKKENHSNSEEVDIVKVSHCDGLLLCTTKDYKVVVWNPCLGETRWIQPKSKTSYTSCSRFVLGYRHKKSFRSYKILRYWTSLDYQINDRYEIFELSSDSWRFLDEIPLDCAVERHSFSVKGNTFWIAFDRKERYQFVLMFYFTTERFTRLSLPPFMSIAACTTVLSVVREEQLSVLRNSSASQNLEIWVTNKIDTTEEALSWSKSFTVDFKNTPCDLINSYFVSCLINEEKKVVLCCGISRKSSMNMVYTIGEDGGYYTETPYVDEPTYSSCLYGNSTNVWWPFVFNYVPSLVHIF